VYGSPNRLYLYPPLAPKRRYDDAIPLELLTGGASQLGPVIAKVLETSEDPLALNEALEPLTRYSLIRLDVETQTYSIHRMVQEVVKDQMGGVVQAEWVERVVRAVAQNFPISLGCWL
jgi:hypothetical protein